MNFGGYRNRVAWVDLAVGESEYKPIEEENARKYIGGRGLGAKYVFDNGPQVEPLSPDNILCMMTGPLSGTDVNLSGRLAVCTKSPQTGTIVDSHHGGWSGARLKWAGLDGIVFKGKCDKPMYAYVEGGELSLRDASGLWGKSVHETVKALQEVHGEKDLSVMTIGRAGENLVSFACIVNEHDRASGRGGTGAVMGSKNLKAVVVGGMPTRNAKSSYFEPHEKISGETIQETILVGDPTCHACPVACKKEVEITEGPHAGLHMESVEYESAWAFGANCDMSDASALAALIDRCNDFGLDTIEAGNALSVTMEATERGLLDGDGLAWGDSAGMLGLLRKITYREGIGDDIANSPARAAEKWGAPEISMSVKGMSIPAYDPRGIKGMGIAYATSNRGACHLRGYTPAAEVIGNVLGGTGLTHPLQWKGKGKLTVVFQHVHTVTDCLDVCKFATFSENLDAFAEQYATITGNPMDADGLLKVGERVYNLERHYNNL